MHVAKAESPCTARRNIESESLLAQLNLSETAHRLGRAGTRFSTPNTLRLRAVENAWSTGMVWSKKDRSLKRRSDTSRRWSRCSLTNVFQISKTQVKKLLRFEGRMILKENRIDKQMCALV